MESIGPYRILGELGRGAMGVVLRAHDPQLDREVAIKLLTGRSSGPARERFRREGEALARLKHPHVIGVHAVGEHAGQPYLVLPLVRGQSLDDLLQREGPSPCEHVIALGEALADALAAVHALGLLHRDLKPGNILIDRGAPLLTDFGLVKDLAVSGQGLSKTGAMMGTPGYWSPEQAVGEGARVGPATDVYGLGAVLYALLTGRAPTPQAVGPAAIVATVDRPPTPPRALRPEVPADLEQVVLRCLEKDPADRYAHGGELRDDLGRVRRGEALTWRPRSGRRRWAAAALLALGVGSLAAGWAWSQVAAPAAQVQASPTGPAATASSLVERAWSAWLDGRRGEAQTLLDEALRSDASSAPAWRERARLALLEGDPVAARQAAQRALELEPGNSAALARLALALRALGDFPAALEVAARAAAEPACGEAITAASWVRASAATQHGEEVEAELLDVALAGAARSPDSAYAYTLLARVRLAADDLAGALNACDRALDLAPAFPWARSSRIDCLLTKQEARPAVREAEGLVVDHDDWGLAWTLRARAHQLAGDAERALADIDRAIALAPGSPRPWVWRAEQHAQAQRFAAAVEDLTAALELAPALGIARLNRAINNLNRQEFQASLADYDVLVAQGEVDLPRPGAVYGLRGAARLGLGDRDGALEDLEREVAVAPTSARGWALVAQLRHYLGRLEGAREAYDRALDLGVTDPTLLAGRGEVRAQLGDLPGAVEDFQRAARLDPTHSARLGELEQALADR